MKLRIKGNSIRLRLSRSDVKSFGESGHFAETTQFPGHTLNYCLQRGGNGNDLCASIHNNTIMVMMPDEMAEKWVNTETVGYHSEMRTGIAGSLFILVEKDFQCLDETVEDQSDNFENPGKIC